MKSKSLSALLLTTAISLPLGALALEEPTAGKNPPHDANSQTVPGPGAKSQTAAERRGVPQEHELTFRSLDINRDGYISRDEARNSADLNRRFKDLDKNGDGKLSQEEMSAAVSTPEQPAKMRSRAATGNTPHAASQGLGTSSPRYE